MSITENESTTIRECIQKIKDCAEFLSKSVKEIENEIKDYTITAATTTTPTLTEKKDHTKDYDKIRKLIKKISKECKQKIQHAIKSIKESDDSNLETSSVADDDTADDQTANDRIPPSSCSEVNIEANSEVTITCNGDKMNGHEQPKENGKATPDPLPKDKAEETKDPSEVEIRPTEDQNPSIVNSNPPPVNPNPPVEEVKTKIRLVAIEKLLDPKVMASSSANNASPFRPRPLSPAYISPRINTNTNTSASIIILDSDEDVPPEMARADNLLNSILNGPTKATAPASKKTGEINPKVTNGEKESPSGATSAPQVMPLKIRISRCKISESLVKSGKRVIKLSKVPALARAASTDSSEDSEPKRKRRRREWVESSSDSSDADFDFPRGGRRKGKYEKDSDWERKMSRTSKSRSERSKRRRDDKDKERRRREERKRDGRRDKPSTSSRDKSRSHSSKHRKKIIDDSESESGGNSGKENNPSLDKIESLLLEMEASPTKNNDDKVSTSSKTSKSSAQRKDENKNTKSDEEKSTSKPDKDNFDGSSSSDEAVINIKKKVENKSSKEDKTKEKTKHDSRDKKNENENKDENDDGKKSNSSSDEEIVKVKKTTAKRKRRIRTSSASASDEENKSENVKSSDDDDEDDDDSDDTKSRRKKKQEKNNKNSKEDDDSDSDSDTPGKRKNIRKILKTNRLDESTIKATEAEKERRKRIEERQKLYNQIFEKPESAEVDKAILDFDPEKKEELLSIDAGLLKKLKPHQVQGVKFMFDACFETIKDIETKTGSGCILGHCMGLGKTLQIVALAHTLLANSKKTKMNSVLVITPLSTVTNWAREFHMWMKYCKYRNIEIYDMSKYKDKKLRAYKLTEWQEDGGVCIIGYDMYRILANPKVAGGKKLREQLQKALVDPGPDLIVCDEGHLLKNEKTSISKAVNQVRTLRRIVLSGTPLQNNLKEYYCMVQFVKPNLLGTYKEYLNRFVNPITNGQYTDSTEKDIRLMKNRSHVLHKMLEGCIQRRDYSVLAPYLPPKHEYVVFISLSELQIKLYEHYMTNERSIDAGGTGKGTALFKDFQNLRRIWTHPMALRVNSDEVKKKKERKAMMEDDNSMDDFIDDDETSESEAESTGSDSDGSESSGKRKKGKNKAENSSRRTRNNPTAVNDIIEDEEEQPCASEWWKTLCNEIDLKNLHHSPKLFLLFEILQECETIGDKILLFSQSLQSLDVIESFLALVDKKTQGVEDECDVNGFIGSWKLGLDYFRLDGSNTVESRELMCRRFNNPSDYRSRLFLISTRAGSLGINLVAANRVIIFDASWNPSHDTQSIFRVYRFGQEKPCYIYRFIAKGTMEEKIYERQVMKQATAKRVIDEHQIGRHYNSNDLMELYQYDLSVPEVREVPILPKDRLFAEIIKKHEKFIIKYHEHDSLLENKESENLSEEERKAAWTEFENEKNQPATSQYMTYAKPNYRNGPVTSSKIFGFRSDVLLRLLNLKVRRDHPHLTDMEVGQLVPLYLRQLYEQMNSGVLTLFTELNDMNRAFEMPTGFGVNPMHPNYIVNPFYQPQGPQNTEPAYIHEID